MCNLYAMLAAQDGSRRHFEVDPALDFLGNAAPLQAIWPKYEAPIVRLGEDGNREMVAAHWGFLTPKISAKTGKAPLGITGKGGADASAPPSGLLNGTQMENYKLNQGFIKSLIMRIVIPILGAAQRPDMAAPVRHDQARFEAQPVP